MRVESSNLYLGEKTTLTITFTLSGSTVLASEADGGRITITSAYSNDYDGLGFPRYYRYSFAKVTDDDVRSVGVYDVGTFTDSSLGSGHTLTRTGGAAEVPSGTVVEIEIDNVTNPSKVYDNWYAFDNFKVGVAGNIANSTATSGLVTAPKLTPRPALTVAGRDSSDSQSCLMSTSPLGNRFRWLAILFVLLVIWRAHTKTTYPNWHQ